jgi:hypothetical protein
LLDAAPGAGRETSHVSLGDERAYAIVLPRDHGGLPSVHSILCVRATAAWLTKDVLASRRAAWRQSARARPGLTTYWHQPFTQCSGEKQAVSQAPHWLSLLVTSVHVMFPVPSSQGTSLPGHAGQLDGLQGQQS